MEIIFADKNLERCATDAAYALRYLGQKRAKCFTNRLGNIRVAGNFEDLRNMPGHFHELSGNRKGEWACDLGQPYRLIVKGSEPNKIVIWSMVTTAEIIEIVDYH